MTNGRRQFLKTSAVTSLATIGLAGCVGNSGSGGNGGGGGNGSGGSGGNGGGGGYPDRNITWLLPFGEGAGDHVSASRFQPMFNKELGTSTRFEFASGANTQICNETLLKRDPNGYTIASMITPHVFFTTLIEDAQYKLPEDFALLGYFTQDPVSIRCQKNEDRFQDINGLVKYASNNPGEITVSTSSVYSVHSFAMLVLEQTTGAKFQFVPFDGSSEARDAVVRGEVDTTFTNIYASLPVADETKTLGVFAEKNKWGHLTGNAPSVFKALNWNPKEFPPTGFQGNFFLATHGDIKKEYPDRLEYLRNSYKTAMQSDAYKQALRKEDIPNYWNYKSPEETAQIIKDGYSFYENWASDLQKRVEGN